MCPRKSEAKECNFIVSPVLLEFQAGISIEAEFLAILPPVLAGVSHWPFCVSCSQSVSPGRSGGTKALSKLMFTCK